jgi:hypothetical protein
MSPAATATDEPHRVGTARIDRTMLLTCRVLRAFAHPTASSSPHSTNQLASTVCTPTRRMVACWVASASVLSRMKVSVAVVK